MTFNIRVPVDSGDRSWQQRRGVAASAIAQHLPDVLGFQEMVPGQRGDLLAAAKIYKSIGDGREKDRSGESCALFYKFDRWDIDGQEQGTFWYSDTPRQAGSRHWGNEWIRICTWARLIERGSGRGVYVYNSHWDFSGDFHAKAAALLQKFILARGHAQEPVVVMGDFNAAPGSPVFKSWAAAEVALPLRDAWLLKKPGRPGLTFHDFEGSGKERIDYILIRPDDFEVVEIDTERRHQGAVWPSDHFPLWARLRFIR
jgi:endonuclease/exonuclease/phosphatase family metal-dependent hydrolase